MLHDSEHGLYELMGSLQQDQMASVTVCDHVSVPSTNLLTDYSKQSRRLCNIFSLSFQSWERGEHTSATPLSHLVYFIRGTNPALYVFPQYSPNLSSVIASTNLLRSCFQPWAAQVVLHNQMGYLEDFCYGKNQIHQNQSEHLNYSLWFKSRLSSRQVHVLVPAFSGVAVCCRSKRKLQKEVAECQLCFVFCSVWYFI